MGYGIWYLRIYDSENVVFAPKGPIPPPRILHGVFLGFGRGVFFVKALEEKLPEQHQKEEAWGGTQERDKVKVVKMKLTVYQVSL